MRLLFSHTNIDVKNLYPFTLTRRVEDIRVGIFTIREKWLKGLGLRESAIVTSSADDTLIIAANIVPGKGMINKVKKLKPGQRMSDEAGNTLVQYGMTVSGEPVVVDDFLRIEYSWNIFQYNGQALTWDFDLARKGRKPMSSLKNIYVSNKKNVFIEKGAVVKHAIINADEGPVFIEKGALIMEGALLRGPLYIGNGAVIKMGAKIYGATTIGPGCTVGGEVKNSVLFAYSNKAHDGYLGDSVIGEWCNLGGGTSNSNLKNTGGDITVYLQRQAFKVGKKCGVLMGDYTRTAVNTSINSGTVIGISANVFGTGLTPKYIPSFSWGYDDKVKYKLDKALQDIEQWKSFKNAILTEEEKQLITNIYKSKTK
ncbi:putative sugar nucleotidyl transferase [Niabella digestorum]|jgi:UDP-N-acetylglucosamine diphosphorylase/glucosamine-1-phosphate N-acetyltransferase|uniref:Sugar nucleotidyl transferase n=1 Tax=Niabella digestorum TaxID=3117701 RepID=A0ABU7RGC6_9BACT